ncbi:MAG: DNA repair protein RadA [Dehalococcoidales bacterium]|nr:DNA repair protein RadA [Dehalococcoidales bacterium]
MAANKTRTMYVCQQCGKENHRWEGKCPGCGEWNTLVEKVVSPAATVRPVNRENQPQRLSQVATPPEERTPLALSEFNRVLGGGLVSGSLVLIGGEPGIGKSTLLLQACACLATDGRDVVYVSGEETPRQTKLRAARLGIDSDHLYVLSETDLEAVISHIDEMNPCLVVIDSIQAVSLPELETTTGSIVQVRECTMRLMHWAKASHVPVIITGHVTKEGAIAGPKVLEHIVDCVLYLEGEQFSSYRLLRSAKNRFGSTNEVGIFEMKAEGMVEVTNPSQVFLSQRLEQAIGSAVVPTLEGSRPLLVEIQALTNTTAFGLPRRTANGIDFGRLLMIAAVLSRRAYLKLGNQDIIVNATGGIHVGEPAADLAIALAIASSYKDEGVDPEMVAVGEIGLSGELRGVSQPERRIAEAARLGFKRCILPTASARHIHTKDIQLVPVATLREAIKAGLTWKKQEDKSEE